MKQMWKRLVAAALILMMALSVCPENLGGSALAVGAYGMTTDDGVRVRKQPSTDAAYWFKVDADYVCELLDVKVKGSVTWYKVNVEHPDPESSRSYIGYIHGDYFKLLSDEEAKDYEEDGVLTEKPDTSTGAGEEGTTPPTDTDVGDDAVKEEENSAQQPDSESGNTQAYVGATGQITNGGVNFRATEGGDVIQKLDRGTVVEILTIPSVIDENHWYKIRYDGHEGYVMATFLRVVSTGDPNATKDPNASTSEYGFVKLILSSANLRDTPGGNVVAQWEKTGEVLEIAGAPVDARGYIWYPVVYGGMKFYVREDTVQLQATSSSTGSSGSAGNTSSGTTIIGYVKTTAPGVNLRLKPAGEMILQVKRGVVLPLLAPVTTTGGYGWYYVQTEDNVRGYLRGDCVKVCNADGSDLSSGTPDSSVPQQPTTSSYGYVKTTADKVNLRTKPTGSSQEQIALGVVVPMTGEKVKSGKFYWYPVKAASGRNGYLRGDCVMECDAKGNALDATEPEQPDSTPTDPPAQQPANPSVSAYGYVQITKDSVNLRKTAGGTKVGSLDKHTVWPMTGSTTSAKGYTWYPVDVNGVKGYVRGDCCFKLSATQQESYLAGNGVPEEVPEVQVNYVITTLDKVNLRAAATKDSEAKFNVAQGTVMAYKSTATVGGTMWYKVIYSNTEVWVMGTCVKVMTNTEYNEWLGSNPANTPQTDVVAGYVKTTKSDVNLRKTAGGDVITRLAKDKVYAYSKTEAAKGYTWYYVKSESGYGWLRGDCVMECNSDGSNTPVVTNPPSTSGQEASYTTLRKGSSGTAVKNLVQELINQGYYTGKVTSNYTSDVVAAVKKFQQAKGLEVDGIAGSKTQHALFGTVPVGSGDSSNLTFVHYPAEKIDWFTGGIQQLWRKGANYKIYDVKTGIVWWAHRWSGANHADIEPLTAADTARLCKIYGVKDAQDIWDENMWERRPCLVTIGTRTFACSLDGMPHNPDGDTIPDNNMTGQICLHFTNSKGHGANEHVSDTHQEAIEYAWKNAPGGRK